MLQIFFFFQFHYCTNIGQREHSALLLGFSQFRFFVQGGLGGLSLEGAREEGANVTVSPPFFASQRDLPPKKGVFFSSPSFSPLNPSPLNFLATFRFTVFGGMTSLFIYSKTPPPFLSPLFFSLYTLFPVVCNVHGEEEESRGVGTAKGRRWGMDGPELRSIRASAG